MKKVLFTSLLSLILCLCANASPISIDYQGETVVEQSVVERYLLINASDDSSYTIALKPLLESLTNTDGSVSIPLDNLYINNMTEDVYLRYDQYSYIYSNVTFDGVPKNMIAKIRGFGSVPAGTYKMDFQIEATNNDTGATTTSQFTLTFIVPVSQSVTLPAQAPKITLSASDAFNTSQKVVNEASSLLYINSNCNWELSINTENLGDTAGNYYVRTIAGSDTVTERLIEEVLLTPAQTFVIAKGSPTISNAATVSIEYSLESKDENFIRAGSYENKIKYVLKEAP